MQNNRCIEVDLSCVSPPFEIELHEYSEALDIEFDILCEVNLSWAKYRGTDALVYRDRHGKIYRVATRIN